jgi:uracil-DNA glycosylase family 4
LGGLLRFKSDDGAADTMRLILVTLIGLCVGLDLPVVALISTVSAWVVIYAFGGPVNFALEVQFSKKTTTTDAMIALRDALARFDRCDLKQGARNLVFADGDPAAALMILGEAPGRDEDLQGKPFVGRAGQLLDRMLAAIGRDRHADDPARGVYITNVLPWRPPQNRDPKPEEIAMLRPFVDRHIALVDPAVLVLMGNHACAAMLGRRGITRLRGQWAQAAGRPALPMFHPAYLLRNPAAKREAWADLLALQARLGP